MINMYTSDLEEALTVCKLAYNLSGEKQACESAPLFFT